MIEEDFAEIGHSDVLWCLFDGYFGGCRLWI